MYTVSNRPSNIVAKTRRSVQNVDRLESVRVLKKSKTNEVNDETESLPKLVFQPVNGKKMHLLRSKQESITPQQEEVIKFIYDSWTSVCKEGEEMTEKVAQNPNKVVYYESQPSSELKDFTPFDLESWWGKRLFNTITKSIP